MKVSEQITFPTFKRTVFLVGLVVFGLFNAYAQEENQIRFYFEKDTLAVAQSQSFINFLVMENLGDLEINVENVGPVEKYPGLLLSSRASYSLAKNGKKRIPIKFLANTDLMKMESEEIIYQLSCIFNEAKETINASFFIDKNDEKQVALYSTSRENHIHPSMTETMVSIFVENRSYSRRSLNLSFKTLEMDMEVSPKEQIITLEAQEKKMVEVQVSLKRKSDFFQDYNIQVEATDVFDNKKVGHIYLKVIALSNTRQIVRGGTSLQGKDFVEVGYNDNSSGYSYLQFRGNTSFSSGKEIQGRINISGDYFLKEEQYNLYDTWLELERKGTRLNLGNIYGRNYDYSVSGRGVKVGRTIGFNKEFEVFALENNYNLYGTYFPQNKGATIVGAKYEYGDPNLFNGKISYLFDHNPRLEINSHLAHWESSFKLDSIHSFQVETGVSHELGLVHRDENSGVSAALNYRTQVGHWDFQSVNSVATKNYVGLNRGSFSLNQNLNYRWARRQNIFIQYKNAQVEPEYLAFQNSLRGTELFLYRPKYFYATHSAQIGYQFAIAHWNILISPQVEKQKNISNYNSNELLSYRLRTSVGSSFGSHGINLAMEYSHSKSNYTTDWFQSFRSTFSYRYRNFSLNGSFQANPNDVIELNSYTYKDEDFFNYSVYASYNFQAFNRMLTGSFSAGTNFSGLYKNENQNLNANLEYKVSPSWATTAHGNYSHYQSTQTYGYGGDNYLFRVGLKKYFIRTTTAGNHKVRLQLFNDVNANGKLDSGEKVLANETVRLDDFMAITDKQGIVNFQNVPKGNYTLKINESAAARLMIDPVITVDRNLKLEVGLIKNNRIKGRLREIRQAYDFLETNVRGIVVYARNQNGEVHTTVVNQNDEFEFFLKDGVYDIYIENDKYEYHNPVQSLKVDSSIEAEVLLFEYSKKDTTIKIKKF